MPDDDDGYLGRNLALGLEMAVGVALGALVGNWLDKRYGLAPWGLLVGVALGMAAGLYLLVKEANRSNK